MDYLRIYNELIEHRKMMPKLEGVYYERHHIKPRCMGGGDEEENLVYLTAEDHFIAHLLLAKAYGGIHWKGAWAMMAMSKGRRTVRNRRMFGVVRREYNESKYDQTVYEFADINTGESFEMTRREFAARVGIPESNINVLTNGVTLRCENYCLKENLSAQRACFKKHVFRNIVTGEKVERTPAEMTAEFGLRTSSLSNMIAGKAVYSKGFCLDSVPASDPRLKGFMRIVSVENDVTGEVVTGSAQEVSKITGVNVNCLYKIMNGHKEKSKGYKRDASFIIVPRPPRLRGSSRLSKSLPGPSPTPE